MHKEKKIFQNVYYRNVALVASAIIISILMEVFIFNFRFFLLNENERNKSEISSKDIILTDMVEQDGTYIEIGPKPSLAINRRLDKDIIRLKVTADLNSAAFKISTYNSNRVERTSEEKYNFLDPIYNDTAYINIEKNNNEKIILNFTKNEKYTDDLKIEIKSVEIDNNFFLNASRMLLVFSIALLILIISVNFTFFRKKIHYAFLLLALVFGLNISFLMPIYYSFDEREHFVKAYQIANFDFDFGKNANKAIGWPGNIAQFFDINGRSSSFDTMKEKSEIFDLYGEKPVKVDMYFKTTAKTYMPMAYIPSAFGIFLGKLLSLSFIQMFFLGRIFNIISYALVFFFVIKHTNIGKRLVFALGILPGPLYLASSYSADPVTYSFAIATVVLFIKMLCSNKNSIKIKTVICFVICCSIMIMGKMTYAPLALLIFLIPNNKFAVFKEKKSKGILLKFFTLGILGSVVLLNLVYSSFQGLAQWSVEGGSTSGQINFILNNLIEYLIICVRYVLESLPTYIQHAVGLFGYSGTLPAGLTFIGVIYLFWLAIVDNNEVGLEFNVKTKLFILIFIILAWGLTITSLYITFNPVGDSIIKGVQGRYFTPLLLPTLLLFKTNKIKNTYKQSQVDAFVFIFGILLLIVLSIKLLVDFSL